jgi:hypothetical protein
MAEERVFATAPVVKALRITLLTLLILYGLVFISRVVALVAFFPTLTMGASHAGFWSWIRSFLGAATGPLYFCIAYAIFKLIALMSRGEPYRPASPRHIRRIGYAVFGLALLNALVAAILELTSPEVHIPEVIIRVLYAGLGMLLLGFGFLVIARVLEVGVSLQQDQDLTV